MPDIRSLLNRKAVWLGIALVFWSFFVAKFTRDHFQWNLSGLLYIGTAEIKCPEAWYPDLILRDDVGFDGEFTYYIALDPLLLRGLFHCTRTDAYRYQRILLPALASIASLGRMDWIPAAIVALNILAILLGMFFLTKLCEFYQLPPALSLFYGLSIGVLVSLSRCTNEILSCSLVIAGFYFYLAKQNDWGTAIAFSLAILAKEVALAAAGGVLVYEALVRRRWKNAARYLIPVAVFLGWQLYLRAHFTKFSSQQSDLPLEFLKRYPLQGLIDKMVWLLTRLDYEGLFLKAKLYVLIEPLVLVAILLAIGLILYNLKNLQSPVPVVGLFYIVLVHIGQSVEPQFNDLYGFGRHTGEIFVAVLLLYLMQKRKVFLIPLWINSVLCVMKAYTLIKS